MKTHPGRPTHTDIAGNTGVPSGWCGCRGQSYCRCQRVEEGGTYCSSHSRSRFKQRSLDNSLCRYVAEGWRMEVGRRTRSADCESQQPNVSLLFCHGRRRRSRVQSLWELGLGRVQSRASLNLALERRRLLSRMCQVPPRSTDMSTTVSLLLLLPLSITYSLAPRHRLCRRHGL